MTATVHSQTQTTQESQKPVVLINTFTARPGKLDEFIEIQMAQARRLAEGPPIPGFRGSRMHRSLDGKTAVLISLFDSIDAHKQWMKSSKFTEHFKRIESLIERVDPHYYQVAYESGNIQTL